MNQSDFNAGLLEFIQASPTPFHAVQTMSAMLDKAGFNCLDEGESWQLEAEGRYYVIRNQSSIVAFRTGTDDPVDSGIAMAGAHTDSPCLKIKPTPEIVCKDFMQLGVEVYGGVLLNPWFDRDLSIAGRVGFTGKGGTPKNALIDFEQAVAVIPSLAIHLDRDANQSHPINAQKHLPPLLMQLDQGEEADFRSILQGRLEKAGHKVGTVLDFELSLYDVQAPALIGFKNDFIAGARLDNLLSCYTGLQALLGSGSKRCAMLVCNDHEEVGSGSAAGAHGPFLQAVLERLCEQLGKGMFRQQDFRRMLAHSTMISMDNAHGIHPNFTDKHDANHGPLLNRGPVIKVNANQRYATNSETSGLLRSLATRANEPVQSFVVRSDMGCGSTIGPIVAAELGVDTVDVGVPTFGMHSVRELAGSRDAWSLHNIMQVYWS